MFKVNDKVKWKNVNHFGTGEIIGVFPEGNTHNYVVHFKDIESSPTLFFKECELESEEVEQILINNDKEILDKAKMYDRICDTLFMATGMVNDGDSIKYIVDPEVICDELLKLILSDINVDREKFIVRKKEIFNEQGIKVDW